jgi:hypothetical protein
MRSKIRATANTAALQARSPLLVHMPTASAQATGVVSPREYQVIAVKTDVISSVQRQVLIMARSMALCWGS